MKENCIIYGGAGFIGSHIADDLIGNNINVTVFDKLNSSRRNVQHIINNITFLEGDFNNKIDIRNSLQGIDYAVHLVSSTLPADSNLNPLYDVETNLLSTINLLEECSRQNVKKVIFISSGGTVYGKPEEIPIKENHPTNPNCSYGIVKLAIEKYLYLYKELKSLNYKVLRFANPFGERQNPHLPQGLIIHLLYKIKKGFPIEIWGDGNVIRDYFYICDGARTINKAMRDGSEYNIYNISSGEGRSINQILDKFRGVLNLDFEVIYKQARSFDVPVNILDNTLAKEQLNWKPETDFDDALLNTWRYIIDVE
ncbi:MAG: NAD-dependent epimerase/dehydratase family protein [Ignavibacteriae bacterium]|nr:MAG: NAD-dependent epimerase/dehydratase family protein [Ignavibacteriota bacterium]